MTQESMAELGNSWRPRYLPASWEQKIHIFNEFVAITDYHRKAAIRLLRNGKKPKVMEKR